MKILQLLTRRQYRGAEVAAATFSNEFIRKGHQVIFTGLYSAPAYSLKVEGAMNIDIHARKSFFSIAGFIRLIKLIRKENPDILHANGSDTLKYLIAVKLIHPSSIVVYRNISVISHWRGNNLLKKWFYNSLIQKTDFVTSVGDTSRIDFIKTLNYPEQKIEVVRRGIRIPQVQRNKISEREAFSIPLGNLVLIHVGNFSPEKGHFFLIDSFVKIKARFRPVTLLLLGEGELQAEIKNKVITLKLEKDVLFLNLQENISPYLNVADLILLTSKIEGVPGVLLEAAAHHVPAVALHVGGVGECVIDDETGRLIDEENIEVFSDEVVRLLEDDVERKRLGENAGRFVKENYDLDKGTRKFISIFENLLNKAK